MGLAITCPFKAALPCALQTSQVGGKQLVMAYHSHSGWSNIEPLKIRKRILKHYEPNTEKQGSTRLHSTHTNYYYSFNMQKEDAFGCDTHHCSNVPWLMSHSQGPARCPSAPSVLPVQRSPAPFGHTLDRRPLGMLPGQWVVSKACGNSSRADAFPSCWIMPGSLRGCPQVVGRHDPPLVSPVGGDEMRKRD